MNEDNFRKTPPEADEWPAIYQMKQDWEEHGPVLKDFATVLKAAPIVKRTLPYAVAGAILVTIVYNFGRIAKLLGW